MAYISQHLDCRWTPLPESEGNGFITFRCPHGVGLRLRSPHPWMRVESAESSAIEPATRPMLDLGRQSTRDEEPEP